MQILTIQILTNTNISISFYSWKTTSLGFYRYSVSSAGYVLLPLFYIKFVSYLLNIITSQQVQLILLYCYFLLYSINMVTLHKPTIFHLSLYVHLFKISFVAPVSKRKHQFLQPLNFCCLHILCSTECGKSIIFQSRAQASKELELFHAFS